MLQVQPCSKICTRHLCDRHGKASCLETNHTDDQVHLEESLRVVNGLSEDVSQAAGCEMIENQSFEPIFKLFDVYLDYLIQENRTLSAFWMSYVDIVEVLGLVWASREGVWVLHLALIRAMIPWCFADDKLNYARFLPYYSYYAHIKICPGWPIDHPDVHEQFMQGQRFSVQLGRTSLAESQSTRKLKKPSTRTHRPLGGGGGGKASALSQELTVGTT